MPTQDSLKVIKEYRLFDASTKRQFLDHVNAILNVLFQIDFTSATFALFTKSYDDADLSSIILKSKLFLKTCKVVHNHVISKGLLLFIGRLL